MLPSHHSPRSKQAFTLVELSIVLVILGLLAGGVLSGKSLIRASQLRSVLSDIANFDSAVNSFNEKYFQLPGDMNNAKSFWPATCLDDVPNSQTCNGNGDGKIVSIPNYENLRFWQHLALARLIPGSYNAINTRLLDYFNLNFSKDFTPASRIPNAYYVPDHDLNSYYSGFWPTRTVNAESYVMTFGFYSDTTVNTGAVLQPDEAYNLDVKTDDGRPLSGALQGNDGQDANYDPISPSCIDATQYRTDSTTIACSLLYLR